MGHLRPLQVIKNSSFIIYILQVASLASLAQLPRSPTVSNPAPDSSLCRAAAPRLRPLQLLLPIASASAAAPRLRLSLAQLLPPRSPTVSNPAPDSSLCRAAAPRLRPLQLLLHARRSRPLLPLASASAAAPRLRPLRLLL